MTSKTGTEGWKTLAKKSTVELARHIVENSDKQALNVLLKSRKLFRLKDEPPLLLPEFLFKLRERSLSSGEYDFAEVELADCMYDLTLSKYTNFPNQPKENPDPDSYTVRGEGVDCRNYYRAFLTKMQKKINRGKFTSSAQEEAFAGKVLQRLVYENFWRSEKDCKRNTPFSIRYNWEAKGKKFYLWYPSYMFAKNFRMWLEKNVNDVDPSNPNEQRRIQSLIDRRFKRGYSISLDEPKSGNKTFGLDDKSHSYDSHEGPLFVKDLANTVAKEKSRNLKRLRPAIRKLGKKAVESLILQVFSDLSRGEYSATKFVDKYGISKSTFSRFAGSEWVDKLGADEDVTIPDLWHNTANILAENPDFLTSVITMGFGGELKEVLRFINRSGPKKNED